MKKLLALFLSLLMLVSVLPVTALAETMEVTAEKKVLGSGVANDAMTFAGLLDMMGKSTYGCKIDDSSYGTLKADTEKQELYYYAYCAYGTGETMHLSLAEPVGTLDEDVYGAVLTDGDEFTELFIFICGEKVEKIIFGNPEKEYTPIFSGKLDELLSDMDGKLYWIDYNGDKYFLNYQLMVQEDTMAPVAEIIVSDEETEIQSDYYLSDLAATPVSATAGDYNDAYSITFEVFGGGTATVTFYLDADGHVAAVDIDGNLYELMDPAAGMTADDLLEMMGDTAYGYFVSDDFYEYLYADEDGLGYVNSIFSEIFSITQISLIETGVYAVMTDAGFMVFVADEMNTDTIAEIYLWGYEAPFPAFGITFDGLLKRMGKYAYVYEDGAFEVDHGNLCYDDGNSASCFKPKVPDAIAYWNMSSGAYELELSDDWNELPDSAFAFTVEGGEVTDIEFDGDNYTQNMTLRILLDMMGETPYKYAGDTADYLFANGEALVNLYDGDWDSYWHGAVDRVTEIDGGYEVDVNGVTFTFYVDGDKVTSIFVEDWYEGITYEPQTQPVDPEDIDFDYLLDGMSDTTYVYADNGECGATMQADGMADTLRFDYFVDAWMLPFEPADTDIYYVGTYDNITYYKVQLTNVDPDADDWIPDYYVFGVDENDDVTVILYSGCPFEPALCTDSNLFGFDDLLDGMGDITYGNDDQTMEAGTGELLCDWGYGDTEWTPLENDYFDEEVFILYNDEDTDLTYYMIALTCFDEESVGKFTFVVNEDGVVEQIWLDGDSYDNFVPQTEPEGGSYEVTFNAKGGWCRTKAIITNDDGTLSKLPTPIRLGYRFMGWVDENGYIVDSATVFTENTTVYAHWKSIFSSISIKDLLGLGGAAIGITAVAATVVVSASIVASAAEIGTTVGQSANMLATAIIIGTARILLYGVE